VEFQFPPELVSDNMSEMMQWDIHQNISSSGTSITNRATLIEQHSQQNIQDDEVRWFECQSSRIEDLNPICRQFIPITGTDRPDPLLTLSGVVKQTSKLVLASWQALQGIIPVGHYLDGR
jgi:hypothetical protein